MPVQPINQFGSHYVMRLDNAANTIGVLGHINCRSTSGRPTPPQPHNGFNTAYTPFGNGHVFALSLGGTDDQRNIVPQWEQWQQTGAWRRVETECEGHGGKLFRCDVAYDSAAANTYAANQSAFASHPLVAWAHPGLPVSFRVRVYSRTSPATDLAALVSDHAYDALLLTLDAAHTSYDSGLLDHSTMPAEDMAYWQDQVLARLAREQHASFLSAEQTRVTTPTTTFVSGIDLTNFVLHEDTLSDLQSQLKGLAGFSAPEVSGLQVDRVLKATHHGTAKTYERIKKLFGSRFTNPDNSRKQRLADTIARQRTEREKRFEENRASYDSDSH